jgi:hypothetical protein
MVSTVNFEEQKWRNLCREAMRENDVNKLLRIYLELDRAAAREERERRRSILANPLDVHGNPSLKGVLGN